MTVAILESKRLTGTTFFSVDDVELNHWLSITDGHALCEIDRAYKELKARHVSLLNFSKKEELCGSIVQ